MVDAVHQFRVSEDMVDDLPRVAIPELVLGRHPLRSGAVFWAETVVLDCI